MPDINDVPDQIAAFFILFQIANEAAVYFNGVDRQLPQVAQRRQACTKVIEGGFYSFSSQIR